MKLAAFTFAALAAFLPGLLLAADESPRPNVILVMSDDQGFGDLGVHGNPKLKTPNLDRFARQSIELTQFYVCPVCSPTRSSLMTGRYNYRTGVVDTYLGRSIMFEGETTLAEMLSAAGYRTGIFGKWHLGDNYPTRAMDQGFQESLVLKGGGIGQPSDPPGGGSYLDPLLMHNGRLEKMHGYCSNVYVDAAIKFIEQDRQQPFFVYLPFNAPHSPLEAPAEEYAAYKRENLSADQFPQTGYPVRKQMDADDLAKLYAMIANIDANFGRLMQKLDELQLADNTIVIFLTDNGPQQPRYNAGLHGLKASVYEGGIHVPCFIRWPQRLPAGEKVDLPAAHIDITPTLLEACRVEPRANIQFDGRSLLGVLTGESRERPERTLFFQWHRGDTPEKYRNFAARGPRWKLLQPQGAPGTKLPDPLPLELYDLSNDPYEEHNLAAEHPEIVADLKRQYEDWFDAMQKERGFALPPIEIGQQQENPVVLTRQDWRGPAAGWKPNDIGYWDLHGTAPATYRVTLHFAPGATLAQASLGGTTLEAKLSPEDESCVLGPFHLKPGAARFECFVIQDGKHRGLQYAEVEKLEP